MSKFILYIQVVKNVGNVWNVLIVVEIYAEE